MSYGNPLTATVPTVGVTIGPAYATQVNAFLAELEGIVTAKVTPAGFNMNADLSFLSGATNYRAKDLKATSYAIQSAALSATTYPTSAYFYGVDGNFYVNDGAGNQIQMTSAGAVNSSTTGGITGSGYGSSGVEVNWDSGNNAYHMYLNSATPTYADVTCDDLKLWDGDTNFASLVCPALAADYTLTLPTAVAAGSGYMVTMDNTGALGTTNTPTFSTLAVSTTSTFTGKATFATEYAHPTRTKHILANQMSSASATLAHTSGSPHWDLTGTQTVFIPLGLTEGDVLESVTLYVITSATVATRTLELGYFNTTVGAMTYPGTASYSTTSIAAGSGQTVTLNNADTTIASPLGAGTMVGWLVVRYTGVNGDAVYHSRVNYKRT